MFNLFKSPNSNQVAVTETRGKSTAEIIEEIHESFFTEVDKLLAEAKVSKSLETDKQWLIDKCNRLKALGFTNAREVKDAEVEIERLRKLQSENESKKTLLDAIQYFSFKYPNYKFITEESVRRICQKYGLIYGPIDKYLGTVPEKNLAQIEHFKIDEDDELFLQIKEYHSPYAAVLDDYKNITKTEFDKYHATAAHGLRSSLFTVRCEKATLEIAAPPKDFDMTSMQVENFKISEIQVPDPVVLKPVIFRKHKFYLVVTAWGDEASDSNVVNERMN